jgi:hypothetical protein
MRDLAKKFLKYEVGDGKDIHMWLDNWHPAGALIEKYGYRIVYDAHSRLEARLSSVISNGNWNWRPARSNDLVDIQARLPEVRIGTIDKPIWSGSRSNTYVSSDTWEMLRSRNSNVDWWHLVWFPLAIPKQAFILWLAMRNSLTTGDRLMQWGFQGNTLCESCRNSLESRDHLFFECSFSFRIWRNALSRCNVSNPPNAWIDILRLGGSDWKKKTMHGNLCRLVLSSSVYHLWKNSFFFFFFIQIRENREREKTTKEGLCHS